ncbi:MAG TPA: transposase [Epulopiscium sp.]|nr:transposase [Candidatus Epulonipiscium sp.]
MSFVENNCNQINLNDSTLSLTEREIRFLNNSWAKPFADNIFPAIKEEDFAVLYSDKASRPNTPVNIIIGALILKELMGLTDDDILESLIFDIRFQYALHTTSFKEQPLSDRTLSRFRERCLTYEAVTGIDLVKNCINSLSSQIADIMGINTGLKRMDSMMVASNIKKLSRLELLYTCVANLTKYLQKNKDDIPEGMEHYCEPDDSNKVIYHTKSMDITQKIEKVLYDASLLIKKCASNYDNNSEYQLLIRVIGEQTIENDDGLLTLKDKNDNSMNSKILQNPADPDATYRFKAGKHHHGYVANVIEDVDTDKKTSIISDYSYETNNYSDSQFLKDSIEELGNQTDTLTLIADGAYGGEDNLAQSREKNINLVTTNFQGKKPADVFADFEISSDGTRVLKCAGGQVPITNKYNSTTEQCRITLDKEVCNNCPYKDQCKPKFHKTKASKVLSWKTVSRAKQLRHMNTSEFIELAKIRNGVESLPSILRRKYRVDEMPVRGKLRTKFFFGFKIAAINFKKLFDYQNSLVSCALKPEIA